MPSKPVIGDTQVTVAKQQTLGATKSVSPEWELFFSSITGLTSATLAQWIDKAQAERETTLNNLQIALADMTTQEAISNALSTANALQGEIIGDGISSFILKAVAIVAATLSFGSLGKMLQEAINPSTEIQNIDTIKTLPDRLEELKAQR